MIHSATTTTTTKRHTKTHTQAAHSVAPPSPDALEINAASVTNEMHNLPSSRSSTRRRLGPDGAHTVNHNHHHNNKNNVKLRRVIYRQGDVLRSAGFKWSLYCWETIWAKSGNKTFLPLFSLLSSPLFYISQRQQRHAGNKAAFLCVSGVKFAATHRVITRRKSSG